LAVSSGLPQTPFTVQPVFAAGVFGGFLTLKTKHDISPFWVMDTF